MRTSMLSGFSIELCVDPHSMLRSDYTRLVLPEGRTSSDRNGLIREDNHTRKSCITLILSMSNKRFETSV